VHLCSTVTGIWVQTLAKHFHSGRCDILPLPRVYADNFRGVVKACKGEVLTIVATVFGGVGS
jgi:hypothetical protein